MATPGADANPAWSPKGDRIAFESNRTGKPEIWVMNADGSDPVRLTNFDAEPTPSNASTSRSRPGHPRETGSRSIAGLGCRVNVATWRFTR